jgi:NAD+-dependent protein deacetylase sirtuin 4
MQVSGYLQHASMQAMRMRIPYTGALPAPRIVPSDATAPDRAAAAIARFLRAGSSASASASSSLARRAGSGADVKRTLLLTGAGLSVASGLADYRGPRGTYTLNANYRPVYFSEFLASHAARRRYWARSFLGAPVLDASEPNRAHQAIGELGAAGWFNGVVTQNVDSFHEMTHPDLETVDLHGSLKYLVCLTCGTRHPRREFQEALARLNPAWAAFLRELKESGALATENPVERHRRGLKMNPDGDVDVPGVQYETFRYPPCARCLDEYQGQSGEKQVRVDPDGAWADGSTAGILKPAVVMFGENIAASIKRRAEEMVDEADQLLVIGSSLATYSAWRLAKRARDHGHPLAILNLGGVRGEDVWFGAPDGSTSGDGNVAAGGVRLEAPVEAVLPLVVNLLQKAA